MSPSPAFIRAKAFFNTEKFSVRECLLIRWDRISGCSERYCHMVKVFDDEKFFRYFQTKKIRGKLHLKIQFEVQSVARVCVSK